MKILLSSDEFNMSYIKQTHFLSILFYYFLLYIDNDANYLDR